MKRFTQSLFGIGLLGIATVAMPTAAWAKGGGGGGGGGTALLKVTTCAGGGSGSLADTVATAAAGATITFGVSCPATGPITLTTTIDVGKNLTISGPGASALVVDGGNLVTVFEVAAGATVSISGLTVQHGSDPGNADGVGGIDNFGTLTLTNCVVSNNSANYGGGGINNFAMLTINGGSVSNNTALYGGGLANEGTAVVNGTTFSDNTAANGGGGIANSDAPVALAKLTVANGNFSGNRGDWGSALANEGAATLTNTTVSNNATTGVGGGLFNETNSNGTIVATLTVGYSTLSGNSATQGGALFNWNGTTSVNNTTLSNNSATLGGALFNGDGAPGSTVCGGGTASANLTRSNFSTNTGTYTAPYVGVYTCGGAGLTVSKTSFS
jgi:hypothetical protein